jgi:hypothetical protein
MVREPGNTQKQAKQLQLGRKLTQFKDQIGGGDRSDFFTFRISQRSRFNTALNQLNANVRLKIFNANGKLIAQSANRSRSVQQLQTILEVGQYYVQLSASKQTRYRLQLSADPLPNPPSNPPSNRPPTLVTNAGGSITPGATLILGNNLLNAVDPDNNSVIYTLTALPRAGRLSLNSTALTIGSTFTQADLDSGKVSYTNSGGIRQLTQNNLDEGQLGNYFDGGIDGMDGERVVWSSFDGTDNEIFLLENNNIFQLTNNTTDDYFPKISGQNIVWLGTGGTDGGTDTEVFFYNGSTTSQLTTNAIAESELRISGKNLVWLGKANTNEAGINDSEVYFYNGSTVSQLTDNRDEELQPQISGNNAVWINYVETESSNHVFFYNGSTVSQLTDATNGGNAPQISGNNIAWSVPDGDVSQIYFYNSSTNNSSSISKLTSSTNMKSHPQLSGTTIVWHEFDESQMNTDIYIYNSSNGGATVTQLTNSPTMDEFEPRISGNTIVWNGTPKDAPATAGIFIYDGSQIQQITSGYVKQDHLNVSGNGIVWRAIGGADGGEDNEIFFASLVRQDQFEFTVSDGVGGSITGGFRVAIAPNVLRGIMAFSNLLYQRGT